MSKEEPRMHEIKELTWQEEKIVILQQCGLSASEVAEELNCSRRTIATHMDSVHKKIRAFREDDE